METFLKRTKDLMAMVMVSLLDGTFRPSQQFDYEECQATKEQENTKKPLT